MEKWGGGRCGDRIGRDGLQVVVRRDRRGYDWWLGRVGRWYL